MQRYAKINTKNNREIVLLKGLPCIWGKCAFCDYIHDNSLDMEECINFNKEILKMVTGEFKQLEIVNSASVFELPGETLAHIKKTAIKKGIEKLYFESYFHYKNRLNEIRDFFGIPIVFKCGIETFDHSFRNQVLNKGIFINSPLEVSEHFESVCIMIGIQGQTKEMIKKDIEIANKYFDHVCINVYVNNSTAIKADPELIKWFKEEFANLENLDKIEILWNNTDFGIG